MTEHSLPAAYLELARARAARCSLPYKQPEDFRYDFRAWVSPYTKGAHAYNGIAVVLQDWASTDGLSGKHNSEIQRLGRNPELLTNRRLEKLLHRHFNRTLAQTYATNVFPWVKPGGMSAPVPIGHALAAAEQFAAKELRLAQPLITLALGRVAAEVLGRLGVHCIALPHPAARISGAEAHAAWASAAKVFARATQLHSPAREA
jgi:restriction system protein